MFSSCLYTLALSDIYFLFPLCQYLLMHIHTSSWYVTLCEQYQPHSCRISAGEAQIIWKDARKCIRYFLKKTKQNTPHQKKKQQTNKHNPAQNKNPKQNLLIIGWLKHRFGFKLVSISMRRHFRFYVSRFLPTPDKIDLHPLISWINEIDFVLVSLTNIDPGKPERHNFYQIVSCCNNYFFKFFS